MSEAKHDISEKKINNVVVKPFVTADAGKPPRHFDLFGMVEYPNIGIMSKKGSGKTSVLGTILTKSIGWGTEVTAFVPTGYQDDAWAKIRNYVQEKPRENCNKFTLYTEIVDPDTKENHLKALLEEARRASKPPEDEEEEEEDQEQQVELPSTHLFPDCNDSDQDGKEDEDDEKSMLEKVEKKIQRSKKMWPSRIIVFDDLSTDLRNPSVATLLKYNRHLHAMIIISSHQLTDMTPAAISNLDFVLLFQNVEESYLLRLKKRVGLRCNDETFMKFYNHATKEKYHFLYINTRDQTFRKDFNTALS